MDLIKQYIVQCISTASNNLRLSSEKIEVVAILKEHISKCQSVEKNIQVMKKMTAFSKFAIKLDEIYKFVANSKIDFLKISDKFKEHSHYLIRDLNNMLDVVTPQDMKSYIAELNTQIINVPLSTPTTASRQLENIELNREEVKDENTPEEVKAVKEPAPQPAQKVPVQESEKELKERFIMDDLNEKEEIDFEEFERLTMKPIKQFDNFLKQLEALNYSDDELIQHIRIVETNFELSEKVGFEIITNMQKIFAAALRKIMEKELSPDPAVIESMRACLIVVVAVVRQKDVNITNYLNRAEKFGRSILSN